MTRVCIRKPSRLTGLLLRKISFALRLNFDTNSFCIANETYKRRGTKQPISFGVEKLTGYIVDTTEETVEGEEIEVENEDGNVVVHFSGFGIRIKRTVSVIPLVGATAPSQRDTFTIGENFSFIVKSVKKSRTRKDVEKWDLEGNFYPDVPACRGQLMESFYEAFLICEHTALGRRLKPFSLKHCLYLEAIGSPVMKLINGEEAEITRQDLEVAIVVCSVDDVIEELKRPYWLMKLHSFKRGLAAFISYLTDFVAFRIEPTPKPRSTRLGYSQELCFYCPKRLLR